MKQRTHKGPLIVIAGMAMLTVACAKKAPPPPHPLDVVYGFRDARFGTAPTLIRGLDLAKPIFKAPSGIDYIVYRRKNENLRFHDVTLDEIRYAFFNKQLMEITLLWDPRDHSDPSVPPAVFSSLTNQFGPPLRQNVSAERREFNASWETMQVRLTLVEVRGSGTNEWNKGRGLATVISKPLAAQLAATTGKPDARLKPGF